jgi:hypothetical protein
MNLKISMVLLYHRPIVRSIIKIMPAFIFTGSMGPSDKLTVCSRHYQNSIFALCLEPFALSLRFEDRSNKISLGK